MIFNLKDPDYREPVSKQDIIDVVTKAAEWMAEIHNELGISDMERNLVEQELLINFLGKLE